MMENWKERKAGWGGRSCRHGQHGGRFKKWCHLHMGQPWRVTKVSYPKKKKKKSELSLVTPGFLT